MPRPRFIDPFQPPKIRRLVREFGSPLLILDCERVRVQFRKLKKALPGVDLHYALKPMPHAAVVQTVIAEGGWLDLATSGEVQLAQRLGVAPERCIHTHPIKRPQDIANALAIRGAHLRRRQPGRGAQVRPPRRAGGAAAARLVPLSRRGVRPVAQVRLRPGGRCCRWRAWRRDLGVAVRGLSFHVGSQARRFAPATSRRCRRARGCSPRARRERLGACDTLDIGGGFPIDYAQPVQDISRFCAPLRAASRGCRAACA